MKLDENILKTCQGLVMNCNCKVLILDVLGEHRVFLVNDVHLKTRECRYNEVRDAQDITTLVLNIGHNFVNGMTEQAPCLSVHNLSTRRISSLALTITC